MSDKVYFLSIASFSVGMVLLGEFFVLGLDLLLAGILLHLHNLIVAVIVDLASLCVPTHIPSSSCRLSKPLKGKPPPKKLILLSTNADSNWLKLIQNYLEH